jgi:non-ribosomal peptide synthetase component F
MDIEVLDVHAQLLHRCLGFLGVILNKLTLVCLGLDLTAIQQTLLCHQPINLFPVDQKTFLPKTRTHHPVSVVNKLNAQDKLYSKYHADITDLVSIPHQSMSRWLPALFSRFTSVIEATPIDATPMQHPTNLYLTFKELDTGFYILYL